MHILRFVPIGVIFSVHILRCVSMDIILVRIFYVFYENMFFLCAYFKLFICRRSIGVHILRLIFLYVFATNILRCHNTIEIGWFLFICELKPTKLS